MVCSDSVLADVDCSKHTFFFKNIFLILRISRKNEKSQILNFFKIFLIFENFENLRYYLAISKLSRDFCFTFFLENDTFQKICPPAALNHAFRGFSKENMCNKWSKIHFLNHSKKFKKIFLNFKNWKFLILRIFW